MRTSRSPQYYDIDEDDIVRDGETVKVRMHMMDALQRAIAVDRLRLHDGLGNPAGHKRGYVFSSNAEDRQRATDAYDERTAQLQNAWRSAAAKVESNQAQLEAWRSPGAKPGPRQKAEADRAGAHAEYVRRIQNAWRAT
jgi:hypothetical protein